MVMASAYLPLGALVSNDERGLLRKGSAMRISPPGVLRKAAMGLVLGAAVSLLALGQGYAAPGDGPRGGGPGTGGPGVSLYAIPCNVAALQAAVAFANSTAG